MHWGKRNPKIVISLNSAFQTLIANTKRSNDSVEVCWILAYFFRFHKTFNFCLLTAHQQICQRNKRRTLSLCFVIFIKKTYQSPQWTGSPQHLVWPDSAYFSGQIIPSESAVDYTMQMISGNKDDGRIWEALASLASTWSELPLSSALSCMQFIIEPEVVICYVNQLTLHSPQLVESNTFEDRSLLSIEKDSPLDSLLIADQAKFVKQVQEETKSTPSTIAVSVDALKTTHMLAALAARNPDVRPVILSKILFPLLVFVSLNKTVLCVSVLLLLEPFRVRAVRASRHFGGVRPSIVAVGLRTAQRNSNTLTAQFKCEMLPILSDRSKAVKLRIYFYYKASHCLVFGRSLRLCTRWNFKSHSVWALQVFRFPSMTSSNPSAFWLFQGLAGFMMLTNSSQFLRFHDVINVCYFV